jgi:general secretion pathway protein K
MATVANMSARSRLHGHRSISAVQASRALKRQGRSHADHARGGALLLAMVILTLITTLAASMVWQHSRAIQVEGAERARLQSAWILGGARDWARLILGEDDPRQADHLGEPWATPLAEARLSTFLAADRNNVSNGPDDGPDAFLSGSITDAQARWNLRNLIVPAPAPTSGTGTGTATTPKIVDPKALLVLESLCASAGLPSDTADRLSRALLTADLGSPGAGVMPRTTRDLAWLGLDPAAAAALEPMVVLLPNTPTKVNVNTATREVLMAVAGITAGQAQTLIDTRQRSPITKVTDVPPLLSLNPTQTSTVNASLSVNTEYFEISGKLRLDDHALEEVSLAHSRPGQRADRRLITIFHRERVNTTETRRR